MSKKKLRKSNSVLFRICKKALILLLIVGVPVIAFLLTFSIKKVEVVGVKRYSEDQIKGLIFQSKEDSNSLYLYLKYRFIEVPKLPFVEKVDIEMKDNHTVTIFVYEKMVAGCVEFMGENLYFDKDGIVVESSSIRLKDVPMIKGLKFNEIVLNERLKVQKDELFDTIINLTQLIDKYELPIDTINFSSNFDISVDSAGITVLLGKKSTYDEPLSELQNILKEAEGMEITIDMRNYVKGVDNIIAKPKKSTK